MVASSIAYVWPVRMGGIRFALGEVPRIRHSASETEVIHASRALCSQYRFVGTWKEFWSSTAIMRTAVFLRRLCLFFQMLGRVQFGMTQNGTANLARRYRPVARLGSKRKT
jgi:hypothetical protein